MIELSRENPRYGYRRVWAPLLSREGWSVNKKRVHRLWKEEGLKVPERRQRKRRYPLEGASQNRGKRRRAEHNDYDVWSYDFVMDCTEDGRRLKMMPVMDRSTSMGRHSRVCSSIIAEDLGEAAGNGIVHAHAGLERVRCALAPGGYAGERAETLRPVAGEAEG